MKQGIRIAFAMCMALTWCLGSGPVVVATLPTTHTFHFQLRGSEVVPRVQTPGSGWATVTLDDVTGDFTVNGEFACLSDNMRAVHVHGPSAVGANSGVIQPLTFSGLRSGTISGGGTFTPQQVQDMLNGLMYVQAHTFVHFTGELRGQVVNCAAPAVSTFNGTGVNPMSLSSAAGPLIGGNWSADLDCAGHAPSVAALWFYDRTGAVSTIRVGEILIQLSSKRFLKSVQPHSGNVVNFSYAIPNDTALCGLFVFVQGIIAGSPGVQLTNRLNLTCGL